MPNTTRYEIHPAIGIARLGSGPECFLAPEPACAQSDYDQAGKIADPAKLMRRQASELNDTPLQNYRDAGGNLRRQAARFRVFKVERDAQMNVVSCKEMHGAGVTITWQVHLANRKSAAKLFTDDSGAVNTDPSSLRNADVTNRSDLVIDSGPQAPAGNSAGQAKRLHGSFKGIDVTLGHAWTDTEGRLLVAGGMGRSETPDASAIVDFADNDGWFDDTSDGTVTAKIKVGTAAPESAVSAHVVVAPFDFAPGVDSFVTLYDAMYQAAAERTGWPYQLPGLNGPTDFTLHVLPILMRTRGYRWVNSPTMRADVREKHAAWRPDTTAGSLFDCLGNPAIVPVANPTTDPENLINRAISMRKMFLRHLRDPAGVQNVREVKMPRLHDDDYTNNEVLPLTPVQYQHMVNWAAGNFQRAPAYGEFTCEAMDRVSLEACSGGPFYPGMEMPRIIKDKSIYAAPFRFDPAVVGPGFITQGLAVPWQADFFDCQMDGDNGWWPATRPDKVIVAKDVDPKVMSDVMSEHMEEWDNNVADRDEMVKLWDQLGIVKRIQVPKAPRIADEYVNMNSPGYLYVEDERALPRERGRSLKP